MKGYKTSLGYKGYMPGYGYVLFDNEKEYAKEYAEIIEEMEKERSPLLDWKIWAMAAVTLPLVWSMISLLILACPN